VNPDGNGEWVVFQTIFDNLPSDNKTWKIHEKPPFLDDSPIEMSISFGDCPGNL
jgi:hypothetical protein